MYFLHPDRFIAHSTHGTGRIFVPLYRVHDGKAPYLSLAASELIAHQDQARIMKLPMRELQKVAETLPYWLTSQLPTYLAFRAAAESGTAEGDVFEIGRIERVDRTCAAMLPTPSGQEVLPFVGTLGRFEKMVGPERAAVATAFYACATSFVKHVVRLIGLPATVALMPLIPDNGVHPKIEALTGKSMETLRREWLKEIGSGR